MKKIALVFSVMVIAIIIAMPKLVGFQIWNLMAAIEMSTGMASKLACSSKYVSGFSEAQAKQDIVSYSAAAAMLNIQYNHEVKTVTSDLYGMQTMTAQYHKGMGCSLTFANQADFKQVEIKPIQTNNAAWPNGNSVSTIDKNIQTILQQQLQADNEAGMQTRALLVVKDGKILAETYAQGLDHTTPLLGWSMGKSITAMLIGRLDAIKGVNVKQNKLFSQWLNDDRKNISLENLLHMSSGLDFDETYAPGSDATKMLFTSYSASDVALKSELAHNPGSHFSYSSGTTNLLARWLYQQLGDNVQSMMDFTRNELFAPLGMANSVFEVDASGVLVGSSYIYSSARDWARLAQLLINNGQWNGQTLLSADWVKQASSPNSSDNETSYGYQFWLNQGDKELRWPNIAADAYTMQGNRSQRVMMIPSQNMVIVRLGWTKGDYPMDKNFSQIISAVNKL